MMIHRSHKAFSVRIDHASISDVMISGRACLLASVWTINIVPKHRGVLTSSYF